MMIPILGRVTGNHNQTLISPLFYVWPNHSQTMRTADGGSKGENYPAAGR